MSARVQRETMGRKEGEGTSEGGEGDEPEGESAIERERLECEIRVLST